MGMSRGLEIRGDMPMQLPDTVESDDMEESKSTSTSSPNKRKRRRSSRSSDGAEDTDQTADIQDSTVKDSSPPSGRVAPGDLYKRRLDASPEKLNSGRFEPLSLRTNAQEERPPAKKARIGKKIEITYDSTGTPVVSAFPSSLKDKQEDLDRQKHISNQVIRPFISSLATATRGPSPVSPHSSGTLISQATSSTLLNKLRPPISKRPFCLIHAICRDNDLLLLLVSYLTIPSFISLYAISKPFHYLINRHHTAFILSCMRTWSPGADTIYPWRCYKNLCVKDPSKLQKKRLEGREDQVNKKWDDLRDVPSLKWLQMVVWREGVCRDMLVQLAVKQGLRCPPGTLDAIKRMWFIMDLPLNAHRIALIRSSEYITDHVLHNMTHFLLKVDMHFTDPNHPPWPVNHPNQLRHPNVHAGGQPSGVPLRKMLLEERQLTPLWRVLRGWSWDAAQPRLPLTRLDLLKLWVKHRYQHPEDTPEHVRKMPIMGIPWWEVGTSSLERTGVSFHSLSDDKKVVIANPSISGAGLTDHQNKQLLYPHRRRIILAHEKPRETLLRPDELLVREGVRRKLSMHKKWAIMMFYGFCDDLGRDMPLWTEEEILRMMKGLPPRVIKKKVESKEAQVEPGSALWTTLPPKSSG